MSNPEAVATQIAERLAACPIKLYEVQNPYHEPSCPLDVEALAKMQKLQVTAGFQKIRANLWQYVDLSYLSK